jgi:predicted dehydrogenase
MILRTIHVGVGGNGQWSTEVLGVDPRFRPVALVDTQSVTAKTAQYKLGLAGHKNVPIFSGLTGALSQIEADALVICTPVKTHAEYAKMAFATGMHALVDEAMATDWEQARQLVADADASWAKLVVARRHRFDPCEQTIGYILSKPDHPFSPGTVGLVEYVHRRYRPDPRGWDYPYAVVWEQCGHHLDSLAAWLGPIARVTARAYAPPWTQYVHHANLSASIEFKGGVLCDYRVENDATLPEWRATFQGDRGALVLDGHEGVRFFPRPGQQLGTSEARVVECDVMDCVSAEQCVADEFFRYAVEDVEPPTSGKRDLETMRASEALVRSARSQKTVEVSEVG